MTGASSPTDSRRLTRLTDVSRAFTNAASLTDLLRLAADRAAELLDAEKAILMLADETGQLSVRAAFGVEPDLIDRFREAFDETLAERLRGLFAGVAPSQFIGVPLVVQ